jgi:hypothetical protein
MPADAPISAAWLAEVSGLPVTGVDAQLVGRFSSEVLRLTCEGPDVVPATLILKRPNALNVDRLGESFSNEALFYRSVASELPVRTPRCYASGDRYLLLEDMPWKTFSWQRGATAAHTRAAMDALRQLHTSSIVPPRWLPSFTNHQFRDSLAARARLGWDRHHQALLRWCPGFAAIGERFVSRAGQSYQALASEPVLLHGDAHLENLPLMDREPGVVLFDWQGPRWGHRLFDVACFLVMSLPPDERRAQEADILHGYLQHPPTSTELTLLGCAIAARASGIIELAADLSPERVASPGFGWVVNRCLQAAVDHADDIL